MKSKVGKHLEALSREREIRIIQRGMNGGGIRNTKKIEIFRKTFYNPSKVHTYINILMEV